VPDAPDAWLLATARRELLQAARHRRVEQAPETLAVLEPDLQAPDTPDVSDHRLRLMFVCAHPALAPAMHAPLMLQAVLGLHAETLAQAFLVSPSAMAQRLVRAKARIRGAGLRFETPEAR
jgi:RNA polymerase sigma-70 factor (ECF subfamily)